MQSSYVSEEETHTLRDFITYLGFTDNLRQSQDHNENIQTSTSNHEMDYNNYIKQNRHGKKNDDKASGGTSTSFIN